jgi:hypothetical protein
MPSQSGAAKPLAVFVVEKIGWRQGLKALSFLAAWGIATENVGHPVTMQEYTDYWGQSLATSYKEREAFGQIWPEATGSPGVVWDRIKRQVHERERRSVAAAEVLAAKL